MLGLAPKLLAPDWRPLRDAVWAFDQWVWILALLGFARLLLNHDNTARRYLTDAVFPLYIIHQTAIVRSEEHTSELQSLMRISYAVFCLKKKNTTTIQYAPQPLNTTKL